MQEDQRLLAQHNEYRVAQLRQLAQNEEPGPEAAHAVLLDVAVGLETRGSVSERSESYICIAIQLSVNQPKFKADWDCNWDWQKGVQYQPGNADGVEESVVTQHMNQLRRRSGSSHDAKHGQHCVPYDQRTSQLKSGKKIELRKV